MKKKYLICYLIRFTGSGGKFRLLVMDQKLFFGPGRKNFRNVVDTTQGVSSKYMLSK